MAGKVLKFCFVKKTLLTVLSISLREKNLKLGNGKCLKTIQKITNIGAHTETLIDPIGFFSFHNPSFIGKGIF